MSERLLVIDCATPALSSALFEDTVCLAHQHIELGRGHAEALLPAIAALPDGGRASRILVDIGPGSFTGVRVGLAAATALGFAWSIPVQGYGCLDLVAAMVRDQYAPDVPFPVVMVGGHGELFWALYPPAGDPKAAEPVAVSSTPIDELAEQLGDAIVYGSGAQTLVEARGSGTAVPLLPHARSIALLSPLQRSLPAKPMAERAKPNGSPRA